MSPNVQPRSYRLWIPLTGAAAAAFVTEIHASLTGPEPEPKRRRMDPVHEPHPLVSAISTKEDFASMMRIYFGARANIPTISVDDAGGDRSGNHILSLLDARTYLQNAAVIEKHQKQRIDNVQSALEHYVEYGGNQALSFFPHSKVECLTRHITVGPGGLLKKATDLLGFLLPHYVPPARLVRNKLRVVLDSIGEPWNAEYDTMSIEDLIKAAPGGTASFTDPIDYSPISVSATEHPDGHTVFSAASAQLEEAYPVASRLKRKNIVRLAGARSVSPDEVNRVYENIVHETSTLLSTRLDGVPTVYSDLIKESTEGLIAIQSAGAAQKMFFQQKPPHKYTGFGFRMLRLLMGASNCLRLLEQQSMLFLLLFARHFTVTANRSGIGGGLTIVAGPPDTGKSRACEQTLSSIAVCLHVQSDGQSEKGT